MPEPFLQSVLTARKPGCVKHPPPRITVKKTATTYVRLPPACIANVSTHNPNYGRNAFGTLPPQSREIESRTALLASDDLGYHF